jgi:hypothetical protein
MNIPLRNPPAVPTDPNSGLGLPVFGSLHANALAAMPGKPHPTRTFISAERVYEALRSRLGCYETGERGPACSYWVTSAGTRFRVNDPMADLSSAPVMRNGGRQQLYYSYRYAVGLLRSVNLANFAGEPSLPP